MEGPGQGKPERRKFRRVRVLKRGKAVFGNNMSVFNCTIRDLSEGGARLACDQAVMLPPEFRLLFVAEGEMRDVRIAWRKADQLGVEFLSPPRKSTHYG